MVGIKHRVPFALRSLPWRARWVHGTKAYKERPVRSALKLARWTLLELMGSDAEVVLNDGQSLRSSSRNFSSLSVYMTGERDAEFQAFIARRLRPGGTFVDVGANIGVYSVFASRIVGEGGRVVSIEANPKTYRYLLANVERNGIKNVTARNCAAGEAGGTLLLTENKRNIGETHVTSTGETGISIDVDTLDAILAAQGVERVDYIKIDVEGFEQSVLRGARNTLVRNRDVVVQTEIVDSHARRYGNSTTQIADYMAGLGLKPFAPDEAGSPSPVAASRLGILTDVLWMRDGGPPN